MEMDKLGVITTFLHSIVVYNIPLLYGTVGEITVEKSGSLNLGVEGIMAVGAIFGYLVGCWTNNLILGILTGFLAGALCGLLFAVLTVSLQAEGGEGQAGDVLVGLERHGEHREQQPAQGGSEEGRQYPHQQAVGVTPHDVAEDGTHRHDALYAQVQAA